MVRIGLAGLVFAMGLRLAGAQVSESAAGPVQTGSAPAVAPIVVPAVVPGAAQGTPMYLKGPKGKLVYVGPKTVVELAPAPVLDEEGKQRLDPTGRPMFYPPVSQLRDKRGNPVFDEKGQPVMQAAGNLGFDEHGRKLREARVKPPKVVSVSIARGIFTVDGLPAKAGLNYQIADLQYIYLYAPWVGMVVVSNHSFPGATEQAAAFEEKTLTVTVGDHSLQLYSDNRLLGKKAEPAYVLVDRSFTLPTRFPVVGYGTTLKAPYAWPGSRENAVLKGAAAPALPENLKPVTLLTACPPGQMRAAGPAVLPGQIAPPQPCVAIAAALARSGGAAAPGEKESGSATNGAGSSPPRP